jgi:hypothetical protein
MFSPPRYQGDRPVPGAVNTESVDDEHYKFHTPQESHMCEGIDALSGALPPSP